MNSCRSRLDLLVLYRSSAPIGASYCCLSLDGMRSANIPTLAVITHTARTGSENAARIECAGYPHQAAGRHTPEVAGGGGQEGTEVTSFRSAGGCFTLSQSNVKATARSDEQRMRSGGWRLVTSRRRLGGRDEQRPNPSPDWASGLLVGVTGFEPATSSSRTTIKPLR